MQYCFLYLNLGLDIKGGTEGIHLTQSHEGRPSGEGYVEFNTEDSLEKALKKNKEHIGTRYVEGTFPLIDFIVVLKIINMMLFSCGQ